MPRIRACAALLVTALLAAGCASRAGTSTPAHVGRGVLTPAPAGSAAGATGSPGRAVTGQPLGPLPTGTALPGSTVPGTVPPVVEHGPRTANRVALTFDADMTDGMLARLAAEPGLSYANAAVVDVLEASGAPATFFLSGEWARRYPDMTRRLAANPRFELANHTWRHSAFRAPCYDLPVLPAGDQEADVRRTFDAVAGFGGRQTRYFRFPGGCYDRATLARLAPIGLTVIAWDVVSGDAFAGAAGPIVSAVLDAVRPGSIVVMHLTEANARFTDEALPPILAGLRERGLTPVTVSELLAGSPGAPAPAPPAGDVPAGDAPGGGTTLR